VRVSYLHVFRITAIAVPVVLVFPECALCAVLEAVFADADRGFVGDH